MIGFAGLSHLGINYSLATAAKGFDVLAFHPDEMLCRELSRGEFPIEEPGLDELFQKNSKKIRFTADAEALKQCELVFVALDVRTDDENRSDLEPLEELLSQIIPHLAPSAVLVLLSQVTPGFTRKLAKHLKSQQNGHALQIYYQVETLIFGRAVERALEPERYIVGCENPSRPLPDCFQKWHTAFDCPVLPMRYESAELAKLSINFFLVSSVTTTNTIAALCEQIGADWSEIAPALRLDARIGAKAYLKPGLGIAGGNLERDLVTFRNLAQEHCADFRIVEAWQWNSAHRKDWALQELAQRAFRMEKPPVVAIWGLAYKENTHSTKNSPAIQLLESIPHLKKQVYDPEVQLNLKNFPNTKQSKDALSACKNADILIVMTPWPEFKQTPVADAVKTMRGQTIIDPHGVFPREHALELSLDYTTLGV